MTRSLINRAKELLSNHNFWIYLIILIVGGLLNQISSIFLLSRYGKSLPILQDTLLNILPNIEIAWLYDVLVMVTLVFFIIYAFFYKYKHVPYFFLLFAIAQILRAVFIILTPFGVPNLPNNAIFDGYASMVGMYPSGHTGATFLAFLLSDGKYKMLFLGLSIAVMLTLLFARGHYSIDVFSAVIFAYAVYVFGEKYFKRKLMLK